MLNKGGQTIKMPINHNNDKDSLYKKKFVINNEEIIDETGLFEVLGNRAATCGFQRLSEGDMSFPDLLGRVQKCIDRNSAIYTEEMIESALTISARKGLITRKPTNDSRKYMYSLTPYGSRILEILREIRDNHTLDDMDNEIIHIH